MSWWLSFLTMFNGKGFFLEKMTTTDIQTAAYTYAAGTYFHGDWLYHFFVMNKPEIQGYISIIWK